MAKRDYPNVRIKQKVKPLRVFSIAYDDPRQKKEFKLSAKSRDPQVVDRIARELSRIIHDPTQWEKPDDYSNNRHRSNASVLDAGPRI
jgi:hypothetical protein